MKEKDIAEERTKNILIGIIIGILIGIVLVYIFFSLRLFMPMGFMGGFNWPMMHYP